MADLESQPEATDTDAYAARMAAWEARRQHVVELKDVRRLRFAEIGRLLGISRQRAKQLYMKERWRGTEESE